MKNKVCFTGLMILLAGCFPQTEVEKKYMENLKKKAVLDPSITSVSWNGNIAGFDYNYNRAVNFQLVEVVDEFTAKYSFNYTWTDIEYLANGSYRSVERTKKTNYLYLRR